MYCVTIRSIVLGTICNLMTSLSLAFSRYYTPSSWSTLPLNPDCVDAHHYLHYQPTFNSNLSASISPFLYLSLGVEKFTGPLSWISQSPPSNPGLRARVCVRVRSCTLPDSDDHSNAVCRTDSLSKAENFNLGSASGNRSAMATLQGPSQDYRFMP